MLVAFLVYNHFSSDDEENKFSWFENLNHNSDQPYGLSIFSEIMESYFEDEDFEILDKQFSHYDLEDEKGAIFLSAGKSIYLKWEDQEALFEFVENGNTAMLLVENVPQYFKDELFRYYFELDYDYSKRNISNFFHPEIKTEDGYAFEYLYIDKVVEYPWASYPSSLFKSYVSKAEALGYYGERGSRKVNFLRVPYGDGYFYIHCNPIFFTNYFLIDKELSRYTQAVLAHLPKGEIYYDDFHHTIYFQIDPYDDTGPSVSPLDYILSKKSLKWSLYTLLSLSLLYVIFQSKRKQRIIPVLETKSNTSLEFVETIGLLYFKQNDHRNLVGLQWRLWLGYVRDKYRLSTKNLDDKFIQKLSVKSGISKEAIKEIISEYDSISKQSSINADRMSAYYQLLEAFYQNSK